MASRNPVTFTARLQKGCTHGKDLVARDRARAKMLIAGRSAGGPALLQQARAQQTSFKVATTNSGGSLDDNDSVDVTNATVTYNCPIFVGANEERHDLLIDTGSSNTWLGNITEYKPSSTSSSTRQKFSLGYGSGSISGTEYTDRVKIGDNVIENQSIGVADTSTAQGFDDVDGILGIGPVDLTQGTVDGVDAVPTVTHNLLEQGKIDTESIGIYYAPTTNDTSNLTTGELTFGDTDSSKFTGEIGYVPITKTSPANKYWGIDQVITYNDTEIMKTSSGIVDTGTTLLLLATETFQAYQKATGATLDNTTGLLKITEEQFKSLKPMVFNIGDTTYELTPDAQIWPRFMNKTLGGEDGAYYLVTADLGSELGQGLDFIDGFAFLQRFYSVYDTTNQRVGLATTEYTQATSNQASA